MIIDLRNRILLFILPLNLTFVFFLLKITLQKVQRKLSNIIIILFHIMNTMSKLIGFIIS